MNAGTIVIKLGNGMKITKKMENAIWIDVDCARYAKAVAGMYRTDLISHKVTINPNFGASK